MSDDNKARLAHELLDEINAREDLTPEQVGVLRSFLPERPKQVTLEQLRVRVHYAWVNVRGNKWLAEDKDLDDFILDLRNDLNLLAEKPKPTSPALPAGMRLAEHPKYGRCVVSPKADRSGVCEILHTDRGSHVGSNFKWANECDLKFIDAEPARPEFLETEADYENAPVGTIVATAGAHPWVKLDDGAWVIAGIDERVSSFGMNTCSRRVLRWGDA